MCHNVIYQSDKRRSRNLYTVAVAKYRPRQYCASQCNCIFMLRLSHDILVSFMADSARCKNMVQRVLLRLLPLWQMPLLHQVAHISAIHNWHNFPVYSTRGVTGKFFLRGQSVFLIFFLAWNAFFPVENFHFGTPKTNFTCFQKWKAKKKKKKKVLSSFGSILAVLKSEKQSPKKKKKKVLFSFWNFSLLPFSIFLLFFPLLFFPDHFFPVGQQEFPGQKSLGGNPPPRYATVSHFENECGITVYWAGLKCLCCSQLVGKCTCE